MLSGGTQAVTTRRRCAIGEARHAIVAPKDGSSLFDRLAFGVLAVIFQHVRPTMRTIWMLRLVCREWAQTIDAQLRRSADRYYVYPCTYDELTNLFDQEKISINLFADTPWMIDAGTPLELNTQRFRSVRVFHMVEFPYGKDRQWFYTLVSQLCTLPKLEELMLGQNGWHGMFRLHGIDNVDEHFAILRVLFAQLKRVHTFQGTLGLDDLETILLVDLIKDMPALRSLDFTAEGCTEHCWTHKPQDVTLTLPGLFHMQAEAMVSLSELQLDTIKGLEQSDNLWQYFVPEDQFKLRSFEILLYSPNPENTLAEMVQLIEKVSLMPRLEELTLLLDDDDDQFCASDYSQEQARAPQNVEFCRALQPQLEELVAKATGSRDALRGGTFRTQDGDDDAHEGLIRWSLGILAPRIRRLEFDYPGI